MCAAEAESSSSSEDEDTEKFREAVWSGAHSSNTDVEKNGAQSKRMDPSRHEEDGNELQLTPEFKSHVAKKLGAILDSCISEVSSKPPEPKPDSCENGDDDDDDDDDEGFRLFSTSLPGNWRKEPTPPPAPKRPPAPSSSDSDSEMESRFREAAVSVLDLIPPSTEKSKEKEGMNSGGVDEGSKESAELKKKKKKKKKASAEGEETCSKGKETVGHEQRTREEQSAEENVMKKKKKKKKRIRLDEGE
ncbi:protein CUSTOS isoform X2 [Colossoma macropomum]|uniref:protein CUSTOS isoform X2 n=1 Tax=Colossoma macropomum TaxID=42526 RepID=UPI0018648746|nr:protein CUSTOS isoform X2 [Colossoma macropomum]